MGFDLGDILGIAGPVATMAGFPAIGIGLSAISAYDNKRQGDRAAGRVYDEQIQALDDALEVINESYLEAISYLEAGNAEAAAHIVHGAKLAARHILEYGNLAIGTQERFWQIADSKLEPFVKQGLVAQDEYASMLGIPNSKGELVPFDLNDLRETPGYQFQFEEGQRAVDSSASARGMTLSGRQMREQMRYGDGLAQLYFGQRLNQLAPLIQQGLSAAGQQSQNAMQTGSNISNLQMAQGEGLANIDLWEYGALADLASALGAGKAGLAQGRGEQVSNIAIGRGDAAANRLANENANRNAFQESVMGLTGLALWGAKNGMFDDMFNRGQPPTSAPVHRPAGEWTPAAGNPWTGGPPGRDTLPTLESTRRTSTTGGYMSPGNPHIGMNAFTSRPIFKPFTVGGNPGYYHSSGKQLKVL